MSCYVLPGVRFQLGKTPTRYIENDPSDSLTVTHQFSVLTCCLLHLIPQDATNIYKYFLC